MASSSETCPLQDAFQQFCKRLHSKVPLELAHCSQFSHEAVILKVAEDAKTNVWTEFFKKLGDLAKAGQVSAHEQIYVVTQFAPGIQSLIDECLRKHKEFNVNAESLMKERIHQLLDNFSSSMQEKILMDRRMNVKSLEKHLEHGKSMALNYFENWKHGNLVFYNDQKKMLESKLEIVCNELHKKQKQNLDRFFQIRTPERQHNPIDRLCDLDVQIDNTRSLEAPLATELKVAPIFPEMSLDIPSGEPSSSHQPFPVMRKDEKANGDGKFATIPQPLEDGRKRRPRQGESIIARFSNETAPPKRRRILKEIIMPPAEISTVTTNIGGTKMTKILPATNSSEVSCIESGQPKQTFTFTNVPENESTKKKYGRPSKFVGPEAKIVETGFQCPESVCQKIFALKASYCSHHIRMHQLKRVYACKHPKCYRVFSQKSDFESHQFVHTDT